VIYAFGKLIPKIKSHLDRKDNDSKEVQIIYIWCNI